MSTAESTFNPSSEAAAPFPTTQWSSVLIAGTDLAETAAALEQLCQKYWYPIYAFVRRRGNDHHQAEDLTQSFFAYLLEKETIAKADRNRGKFRTFLLAALTNFLANEWDKHKAMKRGGQNPTVSLDQAKADTLYCHEPVEALTPETLFERRWALQLLDQALSRVSQEYAEAGKAALLAELEPGLEGESAGWQAECASKLGMTENALRVALHRLRRRFGELLRDEIATTVGSPAEVDEEIQHLLDLFSPRPGREGAACNVSGQLL